MYTLTFVIAFIFANKSAFYDFGATKEKSREDFRLLSFGSKSGQKHDPGHRHKSSD